MIFSQSVVSLGEGRLFFIDYHNGEIRAVMESEGALTLKRFDTLSRAMKKGKIISYAGGCAPIYNGYAERRGGRIYYVVD